MCETAQIVAFPSIHLPCNGDLQPRDQSAGLAGDAAFVAALVPVATDCHEVFGMKRNRMSCPPSRWAVAPQRMTGGAGRWSTLLVCCALLSVTGCTTFANLSNAISIEDGLSDKIVGYRNRVWSAKAWHRHKDRYCNREHLHDFAAGFRAGYESVADGGNGCTPAFPDRKYWMWQYQTAVGQQKVAAWFAGFPVGAQVAEQEGVGNYNQIMTSSTIHKEYVQAGLVEPGPYVYPVPDSAVDDLQPKPGDTYYASPEPIAPPGSSNGYMPAPIAPGVQPLPGSLPPASAIPPINGGQPPQPWPPVQPPPGVTPVGG
jgi:hypothetical protein